MCTCLCVTFCLYVCVIARTCECVCVCLRVVFCAYVPVSVCFYVRVCEYVRLPMPTHMWYELNQDLSWTTLLIWTIARYHILIWIGERNWDETWANDPYLHRYKFWRYIYHHHHDVRLARISVTLSLHVSLSFIAFGRSSGLHPVSSHSCYMNVRAGRPAFDWPYAGVHRSISLTISSLLLQQCPACLVRLACIVFVIGGWWPYSWRRVGCCCPHGAKVQRKNMFLNFIYKVYIFGLYIWDFEL